MGDTGDIGMGGSGLEVSDRGDMWVRGRGGRGFSCFGLVGGEGLYIKGRTSEMEVRTGGSGRRREKNGIMCVLVGVWISGIMGLLVLDS